MNSPSSSAGVNAEIYREVCSRFATGVAVATVRADDGTPHGLTVSSFTAVSLHPPLVLLCIDLACTVVKHFGAGKLFAINVLSDAQRELSVSFAAKPEGRFDGVDWHAGPNGTPLLDGVLAWMECTVEHTLRSGDHLVVFGLVVGAENNPGHPLIYYRRAYRTLE